MLDQPTISLLLRELSAYIPQVVFLLIVWYVRMSAKVTKDLAAAVMLLRAELSDLRGDLSSLEMRFESRLDDKVNAIYRRFEKAFAVLVDRVAHIEGRCGAEHGSEGNARHVNSPWDAVLPKDPPR